MLHLNQIDTQQAFYAGDYINPIGSLAGTSWGSLNPIDSVVGTLWGSLNLIHSDPLAGTLWGVSISFVI